MSDIAERVKKIVVEHLGVEAEKVTDRRQLHRRSGRRQPRHRRAGHGVRRRVRHRNSRRCGREDPDRQGRDRIHQVDAAKRRRSCHARRRAASRGRCASLNCSSAKRAMRRVVVTGMGIVSPLGVGRRARLAAAARRRSPASARIQSLRRAPTCPARSPGEVPRGDAAGRQASIPTTASPPKDQQKMDRSSSMAIAAAEQAVRGFRLEAGPTRKSATRTGVLIGSGIGGLQAIDEASIMLQEKGPRRISPVLHPLGADQPGLRPGLDQIRLQGPEPCGRHRLRHRRARDRRRRAADRARRCRRDGGRRRRGRRSAASASPASAPRARCPPASTTRPSGRRAPRTRTATASSWARAPAWSCSKNTSTPRSAARRSMPRCVGYGLSGDAYHITAPSEDGGGGFRAMQMALKRAELKPGDIDYINAHGTSTPLGDEIELGAVKRLFGDARHKLSHVLDQVGDRPSAGRRRRGRGDLLHPGDPRPGRAADAQSRQSVARAATSTWCRRRPSSARSSARCPTASASAAPTPA